MEKRRDMLCYCSSPGNMVAWLGFGGGNGNVALGETLDIEPVLVRT